MAETPQKPTRTAQKEVPARPITRRGRTRLERERQRQRRVVIATASAIGVALLAIIVGVLYDRVWTPSRPVAQVGATTLSRSDYWDERRNEIAREIVQSLQLLRLFGDQGAQFAGRIPTLESQIPTIRSSPVDETTVNNWIDRQVIVQGAEQEGVQVTDGDIAQALVSDLSRAFPPPPPLVTSTNVLTSDESLTGTVSITATAEAPEATAAAPTATGTTEATAADDATATAGPTETPAPTFTPEPTITPDVALQQQDEVIGRVFDAYNQQIRGTNPDIEPLLSVADLRRALLDQYRRQALTQKVQEKLVPESSFTPSDEPSSITVRHILLKVDVPETATEAERDAAFAERRPEAEAILQQLRNGADFAELAKQTSDDLSTREAGGTLPAFDATGKTTNGEQVDPAIVEAALALDPDQISDLIRTLFGWHIIQVTERTVDSQEIQLSRARTEAFDKWVAEQRARLAIQRFPAQTPTPTAAPTSETAAPLPTLDLAAEPTTGVLTDTGALSDTGDLTDTGALTDTDVVTGTDTGAGTVEPVAGTSTPSPAAAEPTVPADATPTSTP